MKKYVAVAVLSAILAAHFAVAQQSSDDTDLTVNVEADTVIEVSPQTEDYGTVDPGTKEVYEQFTISNVGSNDISSLEAEVNSNTGVGGMIALNNVETGGSERLIDRLESVDGLPSGIDLPAGCDQEDGDRFRLGDEEYFFCYTSESGELFVAQTDGDDDFPGTGEDLTEGTTTADVGGNDYCVSIDDTANEARLFYWAEDSECGEIGSNLLDGSNLQPGDSHDVEMAPWVPRGASSGSGTATVVFTAST